MSAQEKINQIIIDQFGVKKKDIVPDARLPELDIDPLDLIMELQKAFEIFISDQDADRIETIQDVYDLVDELA